MQMQSSHTASTVYHSEQPTSKSIVPASEQIMADVLGVWPASWDVKRQFLISLNT